MFGSMFRGADREVLLAEIAAAAKEEARAHARSLAAIAEFIEITVAYDDERAQWVYDSWSAAAAEVGLAVGVSSRRASRQMRIAEALHDRLPGVAELAVSGMLSPRIVAEITWRTTLVQDSAIAAAVDATLVGLAPQWSALSDQRLATAIDAVIARHDPDGVRRVRETIRDRDLTIGAHDDPEALTGVWGRLHAVDAAALEARVAAMVGGVCEADPRTAGQRRADALGALAHGHEVLACRCGAAGCEGQTGASSVVVRVIANQAAVDAARELLAEEAAVSATGSPVPTGEAVESTAGDASGTLTDTSEPVASGRPARSQASAPTPGIALLGEGRILPIPALAEALRGGASVRPLRLPGPDPEPRYRPSDRLAEFVRTRDLSCRFPGCTVPAARCDLDHVVAWPYGPTHASNLACACREHHLAKTFLDGWQVRLAPDGEMTWTSPDGQTATTVPGSRLLFPTWETTTEPLPPMAVPPPDPGRTARMPRRRRTRAADRAARIATERAHNAEIRNGGAIPATGADPPPF